MAFTQAANHWTGREGCTPRFLVVHGTAGGTTAQGIADYFAQPTTEASAHYAIGVAGDIVQCVSEDDAAWANGALTAGHAPFWDALNGVNPNLVTIAIEHCKPSTDNSDVLTDAQKQASFALIKDICTRWDIPMRWADSNGGVTGHYSLDPVNRARCPGPYPWDELFAFLNQHAPVPAQKEDEPMKITDPFAAAYFEDIGNGQWRCKANNAVIGGDILKYFCQIQGAPRLPQGGENHNIPGVAWQMFEAGVIMYDPTSKFHGPAGAGTCYMFPLNSDIVKNVLCKPYIDAANAATKLVATAQLQAKTLQAQVTDLTAKLKAASGPDQNLLKSLLSVLQTTEKAIQPLIK